MFENDLQRALSSSSAEKTFIDKVLAKDDAHRLKELIRKDRLNRSDLLEILYLLSGTEAKLLNYGEWDRYVILKYFVWVREFVKVLELTFDYEDDLKKKKKEEGKELEPRTKKLLDNTNRLLEHNAKFLIDLYLNIGRSSLSLGATGIMELIKNKYEIAYPQGNPTTPVQTNMGEVYKR